MDWTTTMIHSVYNFPLLGQIFLFILTSAMADSTSLCISPMTLSKKERRAHKNKKHYVTQVVSNSTHPFAIFGLIKLDRLLAWNWPTEVYI